MKKLAILAALIGTPALAQDDGSGNHGLPFDNFVVCLELGEMGRHFYRDGSGFVLSTRDGYTLERIDEVQNIFEAWVDGIRMLTVFDANNEIHTFTMNAAHCFDGRGFINVTPGEDDAVTPGED